MSKLLFALSLAKKSGALALGFDASVAAIKAKKAHAVYVCNDISDGSLKRISHFAKVRQLDYGMSHFFKIFKKEVGIFAITDENLVKLIEQSHNG